MLATPSCFDKAQHERGFALPTNRLIPDPLRLRALFTQALFLVRFILLIVSVEERPL